MSESVTEALFQLVVVGSSAGGIEALSKLVASLPVPFGVPLVIAQHLDPKRLSHLAEILTRHTSLSVVSVERQELLKAGTIYVVPSNHHVEITDHDVTLLPKPGASLVEQPTGGIISKNEGQHVLIIIADLTREVLAQRKLKRGNLQQAELVGELNQRILSLEHTNSELQKASSHLQQTTAEVVEAKNRELNELQQELERVSAELAAAKSQQGEVARAHARQMEGLVGANQGLLLANEEVTTQNGALRTENEEYLLHAEEAQAAIEEADTLNEEMQATNEELETLNEELQATIEELNTTNSDLVVQGEALRKLSEELKIEQQSSEREKAQLAAILASMADALVVVGSHNEILLTNAAYQELLGHTQGLRLLSEEGESEKPLLAEASPLARAARGEAFNLTFNFRGADGSLHWLEAIGQPVRGGGGDGGEAENEDAGGRSVVVLRDITERSLRHLQEQFLSLIGHELRTPLTVIKGYTEIAESWLRKQEGDSEKPLSNLTQVLTQVATLQRLIDDLVDVSRLQTGKFKINFEPVCLNTLLEQVVEASRLLTTTNTKQLLVEEPDSEVEPLWVKGDAVRIEQVILNLINNALTHAPTNAKISLGLRRVVGSEQAEIRVQDYGEGIKAKHLAEVFSRFYQVMDDRPTTSSGLGLGLFICQQIVIAHGGTIRVESTEGGGATFIVQLPLIKVEALS